MPIGKGLMNDELFPPPVNEHASPQGGLFAKGKTSTNYDFSGSSRLFSGGKKRLFYFAEVFGKLFHVTEVKHLTPQKN